MSEAGNKQLSPEGQQARTRQKQLETWAADRVKPWSRKLRVDDYDFRSWATRASKNCLQAGAVYEYARESRKLRALLVLMNPNRHREAWEIVRPGSINGRRPEPTEINSYPAEASWFPCSFEGLDGHGAEGALYGFLYCLLDLADYLAENKSFGELFRDKRDELEKAFGGLDKLSQVKREFRYFLPVLEAVDVAEQSEAEQATVSETLSQEQKRIILGNACSEVIALQIRWRFTDSEIVEGMKKIVRALRPKNEAYKPRQPKKGSRRDSVQAALDCLSAMRLASYFPKTVPPPTPGELSAWKSGESPKLKSSAIELFDTIRLGGRGNPIAESNFDNLITEAREVFRKSLPFGEEAANARTFIG